MSQTMIDTNALKKRMIDLGIGTSVQLANAAGLSESTISRVLNGGWASATVMRKLAKVLKLTPEHAGRIFFAGALQ